MKRQQLVMGNWKMNGSNAMVDALLDELIDACPDVLDCTCVLFPPALYLPRVSALLKGTPIAWGAQNVYPKNSGAFTGELSSPMLKDYDCRYVLVGHSERRHVFHEDVKFVAEKFHQVKDHDMIPVLCVGETLLERQEGRTKHVLESQLRAVYRNGLSDFQGCVVAYEPVWAIGTGQTATPNEAQAAHAFIREVVGGLNSEAAQALSIVYGGSVNETNAHALFSMPDVDGGLVGGASLHAQQFLEIVTCINCY